MVEAFEARPEEIVITQSYPGHCYCLIVIVVLRVCVLCGGNSNATYYNIQL